MPALQGGRPGACETGKQKNLTEREKSDRFLQEKQTPSGRQAPSAEKPVHGGHRQRVKAQFLKTGLDVFAPHLVLELLLYYAIPMKDTNPVAHALLKKFGSLSGVFDAPFEELEKVEGVGKSAATLIKLIPQLCRRYQEDLADDKRYIYSYEEAGKFLLSKFIGRQEEVVVLLLLDSRMRVEYCEVVNEGDAVSANIYIKKVARTAMQYNAAYAILAHNHPSGDCLPSSQDLDTTRWLYSALDTLEVKMIDHIIVSGDHYVSMAKSGFLPELFGAEADME